MGPNKTVNVFLNEELVILELSKYIERTAEEVINRNELFKVGLSGGSLVNFLSKGLPTIRTDWSKWRFFFCDERVVPFESNDSTFGLYRSSLIGTVPITEDQFIKINPDLPADQAAKDYIQKMVFYFPPDELPRFNLLFLGMGPDGHTCSLFPGHRLLEETSVWVASIFNSPKPPPSRITFTFPVINNAENCVFVATGQGKAEMVKRIVKDNEPLPAARVKPTEGRIYWFLDEGAASLLDL
uniref:6-phosphogluconolactonase n=1 Tax=Clastoptera arizonana TaxID=38151 RepID=A0A1B6CM29_9HEMI